MKNYNWLEKRLKETGVTQKFVFKSIKEKNPNLKISLANVCLWATGKKRPNLKQQDALEEFFSKYPICKEDE